MMNSEVQRNRNDGRGILPAMMIIMTLKMKGRIYTRPLVKHT